MADETRQPTQADLEWLRQDPTTNGQGFDIYFGEGAAAAALSGSVAQQEPEPAPVSDTQQDAPTETANAAETNADPGFWQWVGEGAADVARGAAEGVINAGAETLDFLQGGLEPTVYGADGKPVSVNLNMNDAGEVAATTAPAAEPEPWSSRVGDGVEAVTGLTPEEIIPVPVTALGEVTSSITQFIAGMAGAGKFTGLKGMAGAFINGAITDAVAFDPDSANLSTLMADNELAIPLLTEALATDPDDPEWMNRMRNATEGVIAGALVETALKGFRAIALGRRATEAGDEAGKIAADDLAQEAADEAQEAIDNGVVFRSNRPEAVAARQADEARAPDTPAPAQAEEAAARVADEAPPPAPREPLIDRAGLEAVLSRSEKIIPADLDGAISFNFDKMDGPFEGQAIIQAVTDVLHETGVAAKMGLDVPETLAQTASAAKKEIAGILNIGLDDFSRRVERLATGGKDQATMLVAGKMALQSMGREITTAAEKIERMLSADVLDPLAVDRLFDLMDTHVGLQNSLKAVQTQAARLVSAGRIATGDAIDEAGVANLRRIAADQRIASRGGPDRVRKLVRALRASKNPVQMARNIRQYAKPGWKEVINEVFINNILSGYKTHLVNVTSNSINVAYLPLERMVGGIMDGIRGNREGWAEASKGLYQYVAMREAVFGSLRLAGRVLRTENPVLDAAMKLDHQDGYGRAIMAETFGLDGASLGGRLVNGLGHLQRIPGRLLMAEDEYFKQLMFRSRLKAHLSVDAARMTPEQLKGLGYNSRGEFIEGEIERSVTTLQSLDEQWQSLVDSGKVKDTPKGKQAFLAQNLGMVNESSQYARDAIRTARDATFTSPVLKGTYTESYMKLVNRHPLLRAITPFIQTPANILSKAFDRAPGLNLMRQRYRDRLASPDPAVRAEANGEMATGVALATGLYFLAVEGRITGGGPQDPRQKELWLNDRNWQPYSINFGTTEEPHWVAINRLDPWASAFGIAGDFSEMAQAAATDPSFSSANAFSLLWASVTTNVTSKTYMSGLSDFFEVINGDPGAAERMATNYLSSFTPFSAAGRQVGQLLSPHMQEARTLTDRMKQNIPGLSADLPVRYNWVTGEALNTPTNLLGYIQVAEGKRDPVSSELRRLNYGFSGPDRRIGMIQLSSEQYQDWARLMGTIKIGGRTLHETLERTMKDRRYDLDRSRFPDGVVAPEESHRVRMFAAPISAYKEAARAELMQSHPDLAAAWEASMLYKGQALRGIAKPGDRGNLLLDFN